MPALAAFIGEELALDVDPRVVAAARAIAQVRPRAARAVLFYGSCLRSDELDGQMLDFYLVVSSYDAAYGRGWLSTANRLIPPNVFPFAHNGLAAKYAVLSEADLERECGPGARSVSVWARFAQPARLVWAADEGAREATVASIARAAPTLLTLAAPVSGDPSALAIWKTGFARTYASELRAERGDRSANIVEADRARYEKVFALAQPLAALTRTEAERRWQRLRRRGKRLSLLRLAKASATFAGGIDYLAWKINRHAGAAVEIKPWQRRWPLVAALTLLPRLFRAGAIR